MFAAHGHWRFTIIDDLIYVQIQGAFNREGVLEFQRDVLHYLSECNGVLPTLAVTDLRFFELSTADSHADVKAYFAGVKARGYERVDYIGANSLSRQLLEGIWQGSGVEVSFHPDLNSFLAVRPECAAAQAWLEGSD
jgi:hypothetical protein